MVEPSAIFMFHLLGLGDAMIHNAFAYALVRKSLAEPDFECSPCPAGISGFGILALYLAEWTLLALAHHTTIK